MKYEDSIQNALRKIVERGMPEVDNLLSLLCKVMEVMSRSV